MVSSKKTSLVKLPVAPLHGSRLPLSHRLTSLGVLSNNLTLRIHQPGLPAWWRLASPQLNWLSAFVQHLSWVFFTLGVTPTIFGQPIKRVKTHWVPTRTGLITLTRGPIACKKQSRVQFMLPRKPLNVHFCAPAPSALSMGPRNLKSTLNQLTIEGGFWVQAWPSPTMVIRSTLCVNILGAYFLLWH